MITSGSERVNCRLHNNFNTQPSQLSPFLVVPGPQPQLKEPGVFVQCLSGEPQTLSPMLHSSTSADI